MAFSGAFMYAAVEHFITVGAADDGLRFGTEDGLRFAPTATLTRHVETARWTRPWVTHERASVHARRRTRFTTHHSTCVRTVT